MIPEVKAAWLQALRSGDYEQATGKLRLINELSPDPNKYNLKYCCLGVLCEITKKGHWEHDTYVLTRDEPDYDEYREDYFIGEGELPKPLLVEFQIKDTEQTHLIRLNDGWEGNETQAPIDKHDFNQIADWIEANL